MTSLLLGDDYILPKRNYIRAFGYIGPRRHNIVLSRRSVVHSFVTPIVCPYMWSTRPYNTLCMTTEVSILEALSRTKCMDMLGSSVFQTDGPQALSPSQISGIVASRHQQGPEYPHISVLFGITNTVLGRYLVFGFPDLREDLMC